MPRVVNCEEIEPDESNIRPERLSMSSDKDRGARERVSKNEEGLLIRGKWIY